MKLSTITSKTAEVRLTFGPDPKDDLVLVYHPASFSQDLQEEMDTITNGTHPIQLQLMVARDEGPKTDEDYDVYVQRVADLQAEASRLMSNINVKWLMAMLRKLPLEDDNGNDLPLDEATLRALGLPLQTRLIGGIVEDIQAAGKKSGRHSPGGLRQTR